jgi:hypothetical protein
MRKIGVGKTLSDARITDVGMSVLGSLSRGGGGRGIEEEMGEGTIENGLYMS